MLLNTTIPWQYIFGKVKRELTLVVGYALTIAVIQEVFKLHHISVPISVPMMLGTIISLLLAFRSNQAYDRWWEARIIWGAVVNDSRTFTRQLLTFTRTGVEDDPEAKFAITRMVRRQIAWCYALGQSLRKKNDFSQVERLLSRKEWLYIQPYKNMPNALLKLHGRDVKLAYKNGWINEYQQVAIDETVSRLCDSMGKCERIKNTVFPATYSLYIHFAIVLFIILLPFSLVEYFGLLEVPMVTAIAASFLLVEKMAIHLQDPFESKPTDTPMTAIAKSIEFDLLQMLEEEKEEDPFDSVLQQIEQKSFFVL